MGVSDSLADYSLFADFVDSDRDAGFCEVGNGDFGNVAFLLGDLCCVCEVYADRLDAEWEAVVSVRRCGGVVGRLVDS